MPHATSAGSLASLSLLAPFVLSRLRGGVLCRPKSLVQHDSLFFDISSFFLIVEEGENSRGKFVLRSWRRCASGCVDFGDRIYISSQSAFEITLVQEKAKNEPPAQSMRLVVSCSQITRQKKFLCPFHSYVICLAAAHSFRKNSFPWSS